MEPRCATWLASSSLACPIHMQAVHPASTRTKGNRRVFPFDTTLAPDPFRRDKIYQEFFFFFWMPGTVFEQAWAATDLACRVASPRMCCPLAPFARHLDLAVSMPYLNTQGFPSQPNPQLPCQWLGSISAYQQPTTRPVVEQHTKFSEHHPILEVAAPNISRLLADSPLAPSADHA
jgi:hypothetical protein